MSTDAELHLADAFPPATEEHWLALVDKVLKGAPLSKLYSATPGGLMVEPLYTGDAEGAQRDPGLPGEAPFMRGSGTDAATESGWAIRTTITNADPLAANRTVLRELERGSSQLTVRFDEAFRSGIEPGEPGFPDVAGIDGVLIVGTDDLAAVLDGVYLDLAPVNLQPGENFDRAAELLFSVWNRAGVAAADTSGNLGADPLGTLASTGRLSQGLEAALAQAAGLAARVSGDRPGVRTVALDTSPYVEAGATEVQELALMLATGAAYLRALSDAGLSADAAVAQIELTLAADADVFTTIAKIRAARRLWSNLAVACGASPEAAAPLVHLRTANRMMTNRDPWVNLLRVTAAAFAAGVGGADAVTTAAFDLPLGEPDELGRRMARNTQLLLQEESHLGHVVDPAGGSWYVETLTDQIATAAWGEAGRIDAAGGLAAGLLDGSIAASIAESRDRYLDRVAFRKAPITGVTEFADLHESPVQRSDADRRTLLNRAVNSAAATARQPHRSGAATVCEPLPVVHWAEDFEALRDASDAYLAATGHRPTAFLVNLGPVAVHTARATFAKNLFAAGGIDAVTSEVGSTIGFADPQAAAAAAVESGAKLVCICSSDKLYAEHAADYARALSAAGLSPIYLAGNPSELRDELTEAGVDEFISIGVDVLDVLRRAHEVIGTPTEASR